MKELIKTYKSLNIFLKIILIFCVLGLFKDIYFIFTKSAHTVNGWRIFGGFALLYLSQIMFIFLKDWRAALFSAAQCFFTLFLYADYTFYPVVYPLFKLFFISLPQVSFKALVFLNYVLVSFMFSLELFKTLLLWDFFRPAKIAIKTDE